MIDLDYLKEIRLLLHNGDKEEYVWSTPGPGYLLVSSYPVIKINEKLQPNPDRMRNGPEVSGIKVCFTPLGKEQRPEEVLA